MTKFKNTKRALLASGMALILCVSMLVGSTFAWFTDSVTTAGNTIQSGTLKIDLVDANDKSMEGEVIEFVAKDGRDQDKILWEPGCTYETEPVYVVNNGNLALKYVVNINGIKGNAKLLETIEWTVTVDGKETDLSTFEGTLIPGETEKSGAIVLSGHMKEEAGNDYQGLTAEGISITVYATQLTHESDSFGPDYDENAPFSAWNGTVPAQMPKSLVVDGATQTIHVKDADAFAYLSTLSAKWAEFYTDGNGRTYTNYVNGAGADYYYSGKWTVSLEADIDLNNHPIDPVCVVLGESTGASAFKGNNHVIRNVNTTTGLFANSNRISYADLTLVNVKATNGALTGSSNTSINNVTVKNATISGVDYVGGLVGYIYGDVTNCKVIDSSVVGTKEVGSLIGYIASSSGNGEVKANKVNNVTVFANNRAAGLVAQVNVGVKVFGNTIDTVTVGAEDLTKYAADAVVSNALAPENVYNNTVVNATILDDLVMVENADELKDALAAGGDVVYAGADLDVDEALTVTGNLTITNATIDADAAGEIVVDGGTLTLGKGAVLSVDGEMPTAGVIRVIDDSEIVIDGAEIKGCDNNGKGVLINVAAGAKMTIEDGTVISGNVVAGSGNTPYALIKVSGELIMNGGEIINNEFAHKALISIEGGKFVMNGGTIANNTFAGTGSTSLVYFFGAASKFEMNDGTITGNELGSNSSSAVFNTSTISAANALVVNSGTVNAAKFAYIRDFNTVSIASTANVSGSVYAFWDGITKDVTEIKK